MSELVTNWGRLSKPRKVGMAAALSVVLWPAGKATIQELAPPDYRAALAGEIAATVIPFSVGVKCNEPTARVSAILVGNTIYFGCKNSDGSQGIVELLDVVPPQRRPAQPGFNFIANVTLPLGLPVDTVEFVYSYPAARAVLNSAEATAYNTNQQNTNVQLGN